MLRRWAHVTLLVAMAYTSVTWFSTSAYGQSPAQPASPNNSIPAAQVPVLSSPEKKVVSDESKPDLEAEVAAMKAENAAVREQLRKMEEQQKLRLEMVDSLRRRLDGGATANVQLTGPAPGSPQIADATVDRKRTRLNSS